MPCEECDMWISTIRDLRIDLNICGLDMRVLQKFGLTDFPNVDMWTEFLVYDVLELLRA